MVEALFQAYFLDGRDIGNRDVLVEIAREQDMDADLVADFLDKDVDVKIVSEEDIMAREMGITGVPTFLINDGFMIGGAQEPETLARLFLKVISKEEQRAAEA